MGLWINKTVDVTPKKEIYPSGASIDGFPRLNSEFGVNMESVIHLIDHDAFIHVFQLLHLPSGGTTRDLQTGLRQHDSCPIGVDDYSETKLTVTSITVFHSVRDLSSTYINCAGRT